MRSSAFDASEKPAVGGKLAPSKISVIGEGLAAKLKPGRLPLDGETTRFVLFNATWYTVVEFFIFLAAGRPSVAVCLSFAADPLPGQVCSYAYPCNEVSYKVL